MYKNLRHTGSSGRNERIYFNSKSRDVCIVIFSAKPLIICFTQIGYKSASVDKIFHHGWPRREG
jgi:hypothetical protein